MAWVLPPLDGATSSFPSFFLCCFIFCGCFCAFVCRLDEGAREVECFVDVGISFICPFFGGGRNDCTSAGWNGCCVHNTRVVAGDVAVDAVKG